VYTPSSIQCRSTRKRAQETHLQHHIIMTHCVTCCSYPNGYLTIAPCLLSIVAYILTSIATFSCRYAETELNDGGVSIGLGLLYREITVSDDSLFYYTGACSTYGWTSSDVLIDSQLKAAQGFGLTTWMVGFIMCVAVWSVAPCVSTQKMGWRIIGGMFLLLGCFQLLTLLILSSNVCSRGCSLQEGGVTSIIAFLFWWVTAAICWMIPDGRETTTSNGNQQVASPAVAEAVQIEMPVAATETTTQRLEMDGTMVIEQIVTRPDGTKTVTTSRIPPAAATSSLTQTLKRDECT